MVKKANIAIDERVMRIVKLTNYDNQFYEIELINDGDYEMTDHKELVAAQKSMGGLKLPTVAICSDLSMMSVEMMRYVGKNENDPYSKADAFVIKSISQRIVGNFYLKIIKPERPTRLFNDKEEAYKWIKQFF